MPWLEIAANAFMAASVLLAARNSIHTWWLGIGASVLFALLFYRTQLYAELTLQAFYFGTCLLGWWRWHHHDVAPSRALAGGRRAPLLLAAVGAVVAALGYGAWLSARTDAYAPYADSLVMMFSVIAQLLLMRRRVESWWFWIAVNLMAVPLFVSRDLYVTALLYVLYLLNAVLALVHWRRLARGAA